MTHAPETIRIALRLYEIGGSASAIARDLDLPRETVRDWIAGRLPPSALADDRCSGCGGGAHDFEDLPPVYAYLLGPYLGDGCLSQHPRGVYRLRIALDKRYPGIIGEAVRAVAEVMPSSRVGVVRAPGCVHVWSYAKAWPCLIPQHGSGKKHERPIVLAPWQEPSASEQAELLLRGLLHSDGCRFINTGRGGWRAARYSFTNSSADIRGIFCDACDRLGLRWTSTKQGSGCQIYVSRVADVAILDRFVGPKA